MIQKVDECVWYPGHIVPIVYVKITNDNNLPSNVEEYNQLEYVQTWFTKYEDRFLPIDMRRPQEDIAEKSKINYQVDEYGFLPQFRAKLLNTSKRVIPTKLIYVGNFANAVHPQKEFVSHSKENIVYVGNQKELYQNELTLKDFVWLSLPAEKEFEALVKVRYNMQAVKADISIISGNIINIKFKEPVSAITPGQACVLYNPVGGFLLGGAFIPAKNC